MRIIFAGTPEFAVPTLEKILEKHDVVAVLTQPDKPKGRGQKVQYSPVKELALKCNIPVYQPSKLKSDREVIDKLKDLNPDVIVVVAYGQILSKEVLDIPKYGCINVHASLLPKLRGAAPINWSIINGDTKTGITTMKMDVGLDTGDMLLKSEVEIGENETAGELHDRLMFLGAEVLIETLDRIEVNQVIPEKQDDSMSSYAPMLNKELGKINWNLDSKTINNLIRGVTPWPGAFTYYQNKMLKIWKSCIGDYSGNSSPGQVVGVDRNGIEVACKNGSLIIKEVQEVGGKRLDIQAYLNGHNISVGDIFE
ncbi:methionyl-tRNA formyltransferase [Fervidicella metallireducens AeB]|uniref:Methionyl-tRNA formyltransferase n=1 Tax=Fervidicella metallireducens AeB TaxID=1403537 RepID=A0A017RZA9_9CLOT|nr:methionyl-tRNA formyltransferase [Fervidicella metallireducens]EYE89275.1 methionyl-tRNA formyltransferase [Fervidicella metallireducens AeB]